MSAVCRHRVFLIQGKDGGDDGAFAEAIYPSLLRRACQLVGAQGAEDLVQDGFAAWYRRRPEFQGAPQMRAYISRTMHRLAINRTQRHRDLLDLAASIEETPWLT